MTMPEGSDDFLARKGDTISLDVRVFHRAGLDGTHHVVEAVEYVVMDDPCEDERAACVLTVDAEERLEGEPHGGYLRDLSLDLSSREALLGHGSVEDIREVTHEA